MGRTWARVTLALLITVQLFLSYLVTLDPEVGDTVFSAQPKVVVTYHNTQLPNRAVVFLTGTQSSGLTHSDDMKDYFRELGSFVVVEYNPQAFSMLVTVDTLLDRLNELNITEIYLFGSSLGGLVALEFMKMNRLIDHPVIVLGRVLSNVPVGLVSLFDQRARHIAKLRVGPLGNKLFAPVMRAMFKPPAPSPEANLVLLRQHHAASRAWPVSGWRDQVRAIVRYQVCLELVPRVPTVLIRAKNDTVVKPAATLYWKQALQAPDSHLLTVDSGHEQYVDDPAPWNEAFQRTAALLLQAA